MIWVKLGHLMIMHEGQTLSPHITRVRPRRVFMMCKPFVFHEVSQSPLEFCKRGRSGFWFLLEVILDRELCRQWGMSTRGTGLYGKWWGMNPSTGGHNEMGIDMLIRLHSNVEAPLHA